MIKRRILANLLVLGAGQLITWLMSTAALVLVGRYFGPARLGELTLAGSVVAVAALIVGLGMQSLIARTVARTPERAGTMVTAAAIVRMLLALPVLCILYAYTLRAPLSAETRTLTYLLAISMMIASCSSVAVAVFQGRERMLIVAAGPVLANMLDLSIAAAVTLLHGSVVLFAALSIPVEALLLFINLRWLRRFARPALHISRGDLKEVIAGSLPFWANSVFLVFYIYIDSIILASLAGTAAAGIYAPATRMFSVALFLPAIVGQATLPLLSRRGIDSGTDFARAARETLALLLICAVPLTVGLATFAGPLIGTVYGSAYRLSASVLTVLSLCIVPTFLNIQAAQILAARDRQWRWTAVMAVSCVANPLLNLWLIPYAGIHWHNPALGAATALLATEILMATYATAVLRAMVISRPFARIAAVAILAGGCQATIIEVISPLWPPIGQAAGLALYAVAIVGLGAVSRDDIATVGHILGRRQRPPIANSRAAVEG